jgi:hypothetical protein
MDLRITSCISLSLSRKKFSSKLMESSHGRSARVSHRQLCMEVQSTPPLYEKRLTHSIEPGYTSQEMFAVPSDLSTRDQSSNDTSLQDAPSRRCRAYLSLKFKLSLPESYPLYHAITSESRSTSVVPMSKRYDKSATRAVYKAMR